jgi:hypothetical protein
VALAGLLTPLLLGLAACDSGTGPTGPEGPSAPDIGIITDRPSPASLAGTWIRDDEVDYLGETALRTTEWRLDGRGTCRLTVTLLTSGSIAPFVDESVCGYEANSRTVTFVFDGDEFEVGWKLDGPDVLVLDGDRFHRLGA